MAKRMMDIKVEVAYQKGPFLKSSPPTLKRWGGAAVDKAVADLAAEGERSVKMQLYPGHGHVTGNYYNSIHGDIVGTRHALIHDSDVVYGPWLEGVGARNETSRFKGYAMFRITWEQLNKVATGILIKRGKQLANKMGGV